MTLGELQSSLEYDESIWSVRVAVTKHPGTSKSVFGLVVIREPKGFTWRQRTNVEIGDGNATEALQETLDRFLVVCDTRYGFIIE